MISFIMSTTFLGLLEQPCLKAVAEFHSWVDDYDTLHGEHKEFLQV